MSSLTAKYRPRRFADVAGQDAVKAILSRAAATGKVAPAYMFSGTRGVGKTTIARIFAKALNCEKAPAPEPCNECRLCKQANAGNAVDIIEIDAASHGGVNDVRSLKEDVGYAPLEGRYKVFIIDEAHMLSTAAFNALLKTLEEPPARVTFILASTEAHKFPATILSRCQHYVFKMLPQAELVAHLEAVLKAEGVDYEPGALRIIARRGAGSVRDSMSLLGQALAYSAGVLAEAEVRACLGLAGQEVFFTLMEAIASRDLPLLSRTLRGVLDQGLDLGFFLRELSGCWRNMFLLRQAGEAIASEIGLPEEEIAQWTQWAGRFAPAHIHACWQMTLDGQQRVVKSLEPAQALELLLLNLACLPDLLPLAALGGASGAAPRPVGGGVPSGSSSSGQASSGPSPSRSAAPEQASSRQAAPAVAQAVSAPQQPQRRSFATADHAERSPKDASTAAPTATSDSLRPGTPTDPPCVGGATPSDPEEAPAAAEGQRSAPAQGRGAPGAMGGSGPRSWEGFLEFVAGKNGNGFVTGLAQARGEFSAGVLTLTCHNETHCGMMQSGENNARLVRLVAEYFGPEASVALRSIEREPTKSDGLIQREMQEHPLVQRVRETFECRDPALVYPRGR